MFLFLLQLAEGQRRGNSNNLNSEYPLFLDWLSFLAREASLRYYLIHS